MNSPCVINTFELLNISVACRTTSQKVTLSEDRSLTIAVPDQNKKCVFPFRYNGKEHKSCITDNACDDCFWCGTEYNVTIDKGWGMCRESCPKETGVYFINYVIILILLFALISKFHNIYLNTSYKLLCSNFLKAFPCQ